MTAFKSFLKLLARERVTMLLSLLIAFLPLAITLTADREVITEFEMTNLDIAVVDESNSELSEVFISYMGEQNQIFESNGRPTADLRQELYMGLYAMVIHIPEDFDTRLLDGEAEVVEIETSLFPDTSYLSHNLVRTFLLYADAMLTANPSITTADLSENLKDILTETTEVTFANESTAASGVSAFYPSLALFAWFIMQSVLTMLGSVMLSLQETKVATRIEVGGLSNVRYNMQIISGLGVYGLLLLLFSVGFLMFFLPRSLNIDWIHYGGTIGWLIFASIGLAFLLTQLIENRILYQATSLVIVLALSFISGVFIPFDFLSEPLQTLANFSPMYYYINALTKTIHSYSDLLSEWGSLFTFGVVFILVGLVFSRQKQTFKR